GSCTPPTSTVRSTPILSAPDCSPSASAASTLKATTSASSTGPRSSMTLSTPGASVRRPPPHDRSRCGRRYRRMIGWGTILYGAALAALAAAALGLLARVRSMVVILAMAVSAGGGSIGWNAILRATHAEEFFTDAPIAIFPVSWQDFGSGVFTLATASVLLGLGPLHNTSARRVTTLALLAAAGALLVDIYLYFTTSHL